METLNRPSLTARELTLIGVSILTRIQRCETMLKSYQNELERMDSGNYVVVKLSSEMDKSTEEVLEIRRAEMLNQVLVYSKEIEDLNELYDRF